MSVQGIFTQIVSFIMKKLNISRSDPLEACLQRSCLENTVHIYNHKVCHLNIIKLWRQDILRSGWSWRKTGDKSEEQWKVSFPRPIQVSSTLSSSCRKVLAVCHAKCGKATFCEAAQHWGLWVQPGETHFLLLSTPFDVFYCQGHLFYWDKIERANYFLHNIVLTARRGEEVWSLLYVNAGFVLSFTTQEITTKAIQLVKIKCFLCRWLAGRCPTFCQTQSTMAANGTWPSTWSPSMECSPKSASLRLSPANQGIAVLSSN